MVAPPNDDNLLSKEIKGEEGYGKVTQFQWTIHAQHAVVAVPRYVIVIKKHMYSNKQHNDTKYNETRY